MRPKTSLTAILVLALVAAACGGGSKSSPQSSASSSSGVAPGVAEADRLVAKYMQHPASVGVTEPIGKPIPKGKNIAFMDCGIPYCRALGSYVKDAATVLGWTVTEVNAGLTPESVNAAWQQVARQLPDGVVASGYPEVLFKSSLATLAAHHVPVVECCVTDPEGNGINLIVNTGASGGTVMADWVIHATRGNGNVLFVKASDYPIIDIFFQGFQSEMSRLCPSCKVSQFASATTEWGTTLPGKLVGYLRSHPDINYLALGVDAMATGLPQALSAAGLKIKFVGESSDVINQQYVANGQQDATVPFPGHEAFWRLVDGLARIYTGQSLDPDRTSLHPLPSFLLTKDNVGSNPNELVTEVLDYQQQFKTLWGVS